MDLNEYQKIIDRMRTEFNIDNFDSSLLEDKSQREFWKELLNYMNQKISDKESVGGVAKSVPMDINSIANKSFKEIGDKIDLDHAQIDSNGKNTFAEKIFNLAKNGNLNFWNESVNSLIEKYLETISDQAAGEFSEKEKNPYKNWVPPTGSDHIVNKKGGIKINKENGIGAFRISDIKNANAATDFNDGPWVRPQYNVDGETFSMVRGDDKSEYALNNEKEAQFTRKMTDEEKRDTGTSSVAANWIRLIMPKYLRYVEVEDLNRNFWVISQALTALSAFLFDNDSFFSIFGDILGEIAQLWENVLYLWIALMELNQKDFYSKIHYEVVYLSNSDYEPYMKYDHFDGKNYITYKQENGVTVVDTTDLWNKIDMDLKYLIADYPECNLCIIPIIRINNYRHNYFNTIAYPGVWYYDRNQEEMGHKEFFVDTNTEDQIINPDAHLDINNQIMYMGEESASTVEEFYEEEFFHTSNKGVNEAWSVTVSPAYNLTYNGITKSYSAPYKLRFYDSNGLPIKEITDWIMHGSLSEPVDLPYGTMKIGVLKVIAYNPVDFNMGASSSKICESINDIPSGMEYGSGGTTGYFFKKKLPKLNDGIDSSIFYPNHLFKMNLQQDFFQNRVCALKETEDVYKYCVPLSNVSMDNYSTYYGLLRPEYKIYGVQIDEENKLDFSSFYFSIEFRDVAKEMIMIDTTITQEDIPEGEYRKPNPAYNLLDYTNTLVLKEIFQKRQGEDNIRLTLLQYILPDKDSSITDKSLEIKRGYYQGELVSAHRTRLAVSTNIENHNFGLIPVYKKKWARSRIGGIEIDESFNEENGYNDMIETGLLNFDKISEAYGKINQLLIKAANDDSDLNSCLSEIGLGADANGLTITDQAKFKSEFNYWLRYQPPTQNQETGEEEEEGENNGD